MHSPDLPLAAAVQPLLNTAALGRHWIYEDQVASTNRTARQLAAAHLPHGLVVTADAQSEGRGRHGRRWHSPAGRNLYVSVLLRPAVAATRLPQLSLLVALALRRALVAVCPDLTVVIKWPNDLWVGQRKLAGILCEMEAEQGQVRYVVVGVGVNVNLSAAELPPDLAARATSLRLETGSPVSRPRLLATFLNALEPALSGWLSAADLTPFSAELGACSLLDGRRIRVDLGRRTVEGLACGVAPDGRLRLRPDQGAELLLSSGEAHIVGL